MIEEQGSANLILVSTPQPRTRVLTLNRPAKRNALSQDLLRQLLLELEQADDDREISSVIITGSQSFFSAGADLKEISELDAESAHRIRYLENLCNGVRNVRKPVIVALGGGFELALMADFIVASSAAEFSLPEVTIGLIPGAGGTQRLTNIVGKFNAMRMILLHEPLPATEAQKLGLVSYLADQGEALEAALGLAAKLASQSSSAVRLAKEAICRADEIGQDERFERSLYYTAFGGQDKREGVQAFLEKRSPVWDP
ncbi:enoyl-CoA hydratase/isomerase family protein [Aspergillus undulatus]|uniref:enoyl-CoA hydratase/isomerase family protein n=1 Tax=Aspergillus undulatus TaxID=1810928 RepID=UPI003CCCB9F6